MSKIIWFFSLSSIFVACNLEDPSAILESDGKLEGEKVEFNGNRIDVDSTFSIEIPDYFKSTKAIEAGAIAQYSNLFNGEYLTVSSVDKAIIVERINFEKVYNKGDSDLLIFADYSCGAFLQSREIINESDWFEVTVDSLNVLAKAVDAIESGQNQVLSYWFGYVELDNTFYTIKTWTYFKRKRQFEALANRMIRSIS